MWTDAGRRRSGLSPRRSCRRPGWITHTRERSIARVWPKRKHRKVFDRALRLRTHRFFKQPDQQRITCPDMRPWLHRFGLMSAGSRLGRISDYRPHPRPDPGLYPRPGGAEITRHDFVERVSRFRGAARPSRVAGNDQPVMNVATPWAARPVIPRAGRYRSGSASTG